MTPYPGISSPSPAGGFNPILHEILTAHENLSPQAKEVVQRAGVDPAKLQPGSADVNPQAASPAPVRPISPPGPSLPSLTTPQVSAAPAADPNMVRDQAELTRITAPHMAGNNPLAHTQADTGQSGIGQIHNPWGRHALQIADAIGGGFFPKIDMLLPGTQLHHNMLVREQQGLVGQDEARATQDINRQHMQAEIPELAARVQNEQAEAYSKLHPQPKQEELGKTITTDQGIMQFNPDTGRYDVKAGNSPEKPEKGEVKEDADGSLVMVHPDGTATPVTSGGKPVKAPPKAEKEGNDFEQYYKQYLGDNKLTDSATNRLQARKQYSAAGQLPERAPQVMMFAPDPNGGYTSEVVHGAGQHVAPGSQSAAGVNAVDTPTMQMRNVGAQASLVHEQTPMMLKELDRLKDKLGPVAGRWNDFMQGKVGMNDPDFAGLRSDLLMYSSAVALMHARGRLPENLRAEFDRTINNPTQDFGNLKAVIQHIDQWTTQNMNAMKGGQQGGQSSGGGSYVAGKTYGGMTYNGGDPNDEKNWVKKK